MIITFENRKQINNKELNALIHDACFYSFMTTYSNGKYSYDYRASVGCEPEELSFSFSGVTSCIYSGENRSFILGSNVNCWYSLPSYPYNALPSDSLTKEEIKELEQHGAWKYNNVRKNIKIWEHEYCCQHENDEKLFKVVFFLSTPAFLEIECEKLVFKRTKRK